MEFNTMGYLIQVFEKAKETQAAFVAILVEMDGFPKPEMIINTLENVDTKLAYYQKTYNKDLEHKHAPGIRIIGFAFGMSAGEIQKKWDRFM